MLPWPSMESRSQCFLFLTGPFPQLRRKPDYCTEMSLRSAFSSKGKPALGSRPTSSFPCTLIPLLQEIKYMFHGHMDSAQTTNCRHCHFTKDHGNTAFEISSQCMKHRVSYPRGLHKRRHPENT